MNEGFRNRNSAQQKKERRRIRMKSCREVTRNDDWQSSFPIGSLLFVSFGDGDR